MASIWQGELPGATRFLLSNCWQVQLGDMRTQSLFIVLPLSLAACSGSDPSRQVESAHSWTATSILIGERWLNRSVPDAYAHDALQNSSEEMQKLSGELAKSMSDSTPAKRDSIIGSLKQALSRMKQMSREVTTRNSPAFSVQLDSLRAAGRLLEAAAPRQQP